LSTKATPGQGEALVKGKWLAGFPPRMPKENHKPRGIMKGLIHRDVQKPVKGTRADIFSLFCHDLPTCPLPGAGRVLVTGASGYIGGRLVPELLARGYAVRAMVRAFSPAYSKHWPGAEIVIADAQNPESLDPALQGVGTAYYLIHSLLLGPSYFSGADIQAAVNFSKAAEKQRVQRIIYLGGLGDIRASRSPHLKSRMRVAQELGRGSTPVTILRAAVIIGSGSASYEIIRHLVTRLPVLPIPHWAKNRCQPIAVRDVVKYLAGAMETPETTGRSFDIGGPEILTYEGLLRIFAQVIRKRVWFFDAPFSYIGFYSYLASLLTPVPAPITRALMEGLRDEVVASNDEIRRLIPFEPLSYQEAVIRALSREEQDRVYTRWSDAYPPAYDLALKLHEVQGKPGYTATRSVLSDKPARRLFSSVCCVGGHTGWFRANWMWWLRGAFDRLFFGVGTSRGRRSYSSLEVNDVVDFFRVEDIEPDRRLLLRAEMKLPGKAWLDFTIREEGGKQRLSVTAYFFSSSWFGHLYWYAFLPFHHFIFQGLVDQIEKQS
jgi:uncharacterized protein YbjT (DUF2867 family)